MNDQGTLPAPRSDGGCGCATPPRHTAGHRTPATDLIPDIRGTKTRVRAIRPYNPIYTHV